MPPPSAFDYGFWWSDNLPAGTPPSAVTSLTVSFKTGFRSSATQQTRELFLNYSSTPAGSFQTNAVQQLTCPPSPSDLQSISVDPTNYSPGSHNWLRTSRTWDDGDCEGFSQFDEFGAPLWGVVEIRMNP